MIAYILSNDLDEESLNQYQNECPFVIVRNFNATKQPDFFEDLLEYRWKPIIVEEVLKEVENVFYIDAGIVFHENTNGTIMDIVQKSDSNICGVRFFDDSGHSIIFATHPKMIQYFNVSEDAAKKMEMIGASAFIISRKASEIVKKWKQCALDKEICMAPKGSNIGCSCSECRSTNTYANCHRFDQSAISIITLQQCSSNFSDFYSAVQILSNER
uniref:Uncharacterized protein n=1 Tax=Panagrolaimus sp. PS1159 TaxID=55785 RepID=A0AC35F6H4_9BILA